MKLFTSFVLCCFLIAGCCEGARILGVFPMVAHSHFIVGYRLLSEMAERGHEVTMINPYPQKNKPKNFKDVSLADTVQAFEKNFKSDLLNLDSYYLVQSINFVYNMGTPIVENCFNHPEVKKLLNSNQQFDVVIIEQFMDEAMLYFGHHYNAPVIILSSVGAASWTNDYVRNPAPPSYVASYWVNTGAKMTYSERVFNVFIDWYDFLYRQFVYLPGQNQLMHKYFPDAPELNELMNNVSLILLNSHPSTNEPVPHVPKMVEIGGYHVKPAGKLPKDLKEFLDSATEGVVYFCMGSNLKVSTFPIEKQQAFLGAFRKLKMKVLWKFEVESMENQPKNVKLVKWAPQAEVLAHPNVKVFVSHAGLLGSIEAVYFGVPVLGIPIFGDQKMNIATSVNRGYALSLPYVDLTEQKLTEALNEILTNKKYTENAKRRSRIMHDRVVKPIDEAIYWVEYVIRHPGALHLRSAAMDLNWFQFNLIDVAAVPLAIIVLLIYVLRLVGRRYCPFSKCKPTTTRDKKTK